MALTERSRNKIYETFTTLIDDEQAVEEMLSYFPARDVEEPVTKEFLRAELATLRTEMTEMRVEMHKLQTRITLSTMAIAATIAGFSTLGG